VANRELIERIRAQHAGQPWLTRWPEWIAELVKHERKGCTGPWMVNPEDPDGRWVCEVCGEPAPP
jgi:hypothetical protein